jgi:hypothetical protein
MTGLTEDGRDNGRDINTWSSQDFIHWTKPEFVSYSPGRAWGGQVAPGYVEDAPLALRTEGFPRQPHAILESQADP